jgi:hypothetical protein
VEALKSYNDVGGVLAKLASDPDVRLIQFIIFIDIFFYQIFHKIHSSLGSTSYLNLLINILIQSEFNILHYF